MKQNYTNPYLQTQEKQLQRNQKAIDATKSLGWYEHIKELGLKPPNDPDYARSQIKILGMTVLALIAGRKEKATVINVWHNTFQLRLTNPPREVRIVASKRILKVLDPSPFPKRGETWTWAKIINAWFVADEKDEAQKIFRDPPNIGRYTLFAVPREAPWEKPSAILNFEKSGKIILAEGRARFVRHFTIVRADLPPKTP